MAPWRMTEQNALGEFSESKHLLGASRFNPTYDPYQQITFTKLRGACK